MTRALSSLAEKSTSILYDLGEVNHHDTSGILGILAVDEERYEALRPSEERP